MAISLKDLLDRHFKDVRFNKALMDAFYHFQIKFVNKNQEHLEFFGSNLMGVHRVRFTPKDESIIFNEILKIDTTAIDEDLDDVKAINKSFNVSSDVFNIVMSYCVHRFLTSQALSDKQKKFGALQAALIWNYRLLTGLMARRFKYALDEETAKLAYANMSSKFLIKKLGSWQAVLNFRAEELLSPKSIHYKALLSYNDDIATVYVMNDVQGRLRGMMNKVFRDIVEAKDSKRRIFSNSSTMIGSDGEEILNDKIGGLESYVEYALSVTHDETTFLKNELVGLILQMMPTTQEHILLKVLKAIPEYSHGKQHELIEKIVRLTIVHSYDYLKTHSTVLRKTNDLPGLLSRLRGAYLSSRSGNDELMELRSLGETFIKDVTGIKNESIVSSARTSVFLYICVRSYTKNYFKSFHVMR